MTVSCPECGTEFVDGHGPALATVEVERLREDNAQLRHEIQVLLREVDRWRTRRNLLELST